MRLLIICILLWGFVTESRAQLVRRKDYDAAFALQAGGETGALTAFRRAVLSVMPVAGLKMTFPFTRKWFLGSEVNYSRLKYGTSQRLDAGLPLLGENVSFRGRQKAEVDLKQLMVPLYLKYMLNCNKACVLFGFYGSYVFDATLSSSFNGEKVSSCDGENIPLTWKQDLSHTLEDWNAGVTIGYEHRIVKHLDLMCRISVGVREIVKQKQVWKDRMLPLHACITLSYDVFRIGDCGCD